MNAPITQVQLVHRNGPAEALSIGEHSCPACGRVSLYVSTEDRFFHADGTSNRKCWIRLMRNERLLDHPHGRPIERIGDEDAVLGDPVDDARPAPRCRYCTKRHKAAEYPGVRMDVCPVAGYRHTQQEIDEAIIEIRSTEKGEFMSARAIARTANHPEYRDVKGWQRHRYLSRSAIGKALTRLKDEHGYWSHRWSHAPRTRPGYQDHPGSHRPA